MLKNYLLLFLCLSGFNALYAQTEEDERIDALIDEILLEEGDLIDLALSKYINYQIIYLFTEFESQTYFSGRESQNDQFNLQPQITYAHSNGIYASLGGKYYSVIQPKWDLTSASLGYLGSLDAKKRLKYNLAYSRYFYSTNSESDLTNSLDIGFGWYNVKSTFGSLVSASYLFGDDKAWQFNWRTFAKIKLWANATSSISFRPQFNMEVAKQTLQLSRYRIRNGQLVLQMKDFDIFDLLNSQLNLPLQYNTGGFDMTFGYTINFPKSIGRERDHKANGFFNIALGYIFSI